jgi:outer membrane usher protein
VRRESEGAADRGRWLKQPSPLGASRLLFLIAVLVTELPLADRVQAEARYASELSTKLNQTGRTISLPVPLVDAGQALGDVLVQIDPGDAIAVDRASLLLAAGPHVAQAVVGAVETIPGGGGFVPIGAFAEAGLPLRFDPGLQQLELQLATGNRSQSELSIAGSGGPLISQARVAPAFVSGYLNMIGGLDQVWDEGTSDNAGGRLELEGALRAGNVVVENRALYDGDVDATVCPAHARCTYGHVAGLKRDATRLVYDVPDYQTRITAGDTGGLGTGLQRPADLLGVSIEKNARKLAPGERINGGGSRGIG